MIQNPGHGLIPHGVRYGVSELRDFSGSFKVLDVLSFIARARALTVLSTPGSKETPLKNPNIAM